MQWHLPSALEIQVGTEHWLLCTLALAAPDVGAGCCGDGALGWVFMHSTQCSAMMSEIQKDFRLSVPGIYCTHNLMLGPYPKTPLPNAHRVQHVNSREQANCHLQVFEFNRPNNSNRVI